MLMLNVSTALTKSNKDKSKEQTRLRLIHKTQDTIP